ncbi:MAG: ABC transporter ATP-binding protein [Bacteroidetes bacterium]|nr:ABC transporter ATP-binding protein [Bacteroidota bacterium]
MSILTVKKLHKRYEKFHLKDVSFSLDKGFIMGFIGINGAGKTTTLKSLLNMVHADSGEVEIMGKVYKEHEIELKREIGLMFGGIDYYEKKRVKTVTDVVKRFYPNWDDAVYADYSQKFSIDQDKKISELSQGMKAKYALALALSHNARLFIFDEPTSGLDPAARDDLLEIFQNLVEDGEKSILYSTHITSDLEKCADYITYIHDGEIVSSTDKDNFIDLYKVVKGTQEQLNDDLLKKMISCKKHKFGFSGLMETADCDGLDRLTIEVPTLEEIMIYYAKKESAHV